jgi:predicted transcriptional regulator
MALQGTWGLDRVLDARPAARPASRRRPSRRVLEFVLPLGAVAQLEERRHGMAKATGSIPVSSTSPCMTIRDTLASVTAISVRLDDEALRALTQLEAAGLSRSDAIRRAIIDSAIRLQRGKALASEVAALEADEVDRREMLEVAAMMESMRASRRRV